jgi:hypothetical protein
MCSTILVIEISKLTMETQYSKIISSFVDKYGLTRGEVMAEIEKTFSAILTKWHGQDVVVLFGDDQLTALGYHGSFGTVKQTPIELNSMRGWNTIKRQLDANLGKAACLKAVSRYKQKEREMRWGEILRKNPEGNFDIEIEIERGRPVIAICQYNHVGVHERNQFKVGQRRAFHIRRVEPVLLNNIPRVKVMVDRVSKTLVENLLLDQIQNAKVNIRCLNRYVGQKSFVESNTFLPKKIIRKTSHELNEHLQIKVVKTARGSMF